MSRRERRQARGEDVLLEHGTGGIDLAQQHVVGPQVGEILEDALRVGRLKQGAVDDVMVQDESPIAGKIDIDHLDVRVDEADVELACESAADATIAAFIMDGRYPDPFSV